MLNAKNHPFKAIGTPAQVFSLESIKTVMTDISVLHLLGRHNLHLYYF